uniref:NADH dehydrogenase subunit 2 n=1 Tax=Ixodes fecialis TaxID=590364 RepID=UPI001FF267F4|nr:NADH dehydrogenase subunit 2 [Ixodes fecialis]UOK09774.1 NADH dehydrogenase subunit 2 [Ixodes fecialis]
MIFPNIILLWMIGMSILMSFSTNLWFSFWISMEINMLVFIPMLNSKTFLSCNSMINYFIIQSLASSIFLLNSILYYYSSLTIFYTIIIMSLLIKMASAPFHFWFPQVSESISFWSFFLLSTIQKIIPLQILTIFNSQKITLFIILTAIVGTLGGFNQTSFRKILAFSSISHLAWMMTLIMINQFFWVVYFLIYSFIIMKMILFLTNNFINTINNLHSKKMTSLNKFQIFSLLMSLAGLPPFMGFMMKLFSISLIFNKIPFILIILILSSLGNMYFYSRTLFPMIMMHNIMLKMYNFSFIKTMNFFMINLLMLLIMIPFMKSI